jgi:hypothetical protein
MSENKDQGRSVNSGQQLATGYEAPRVTVLGNARDLLAGGSGSQTDGAMCITPQEQTRANGNGC